MHERLESARALLRHRFPDGDIAAIVDAGLVALLEKTEKRKFARTDRPTSGRKGGAPKERTQVDPGGSAAVAARSDRSIPAAVRREVWKRDGGRCGYRSPEAHRCEERALLEFHHLEPFAVGGKTTIDNLALRCRAHNRLDAVQTLGARTIERARALRADPSRQGGFEPTSCRLVIARDDCPGTRRLTG